MSSKGQPKPRSTAIEKNTGGWSEVRVPEKKKHVDKIE